MFQALCTIALLCVLTAAQAQTPGESVRLPGQVRFAAGADEDARRLLSFQHPVNLRQEPPKGVKLPSWVNASCRYGTLKLGKPPQEWHVLVEVGGSRVVVDLNRNGDLTDDEVLRGSGDVVWLMGMFGPFRLNIPVNGSLVARYFTLFADEMDRGRLYLRSEDYRVFEGVVNGKPIRMVLMDSNADGVFDTPGRGRWEGDICYFPPHSDAQALPRYRLVDDRFYRLTIASDGSWCEWTPTEVQMATVTADYPLLRLVATGKEVGYWEASTEDGRLQMPADEYSVIGYTFGVRDSKGDLWQVTVSPMDPLPLKVGEGENRFPVPKELNATLGVGTRQGDMLNVSLVLSVGGRLQMVTSVQRNGRLPPEPRLRIVDRNGKTVKVEKFHYG